MTALDLLKEGATKGYEELSTALQGVTEEQAWAVLPNHGTDYLHSGGSIYSIALHTATVKWAYGSIGFRDTEIRWRDIADQLDAIEPSWSAALDYMERGHRYWMESWDDLVDIEAMRPTNWKVGECPAWKIIQTMNQHDAYHAGQVAILRYGGTATNVPPALEAEDIRTHCRDSKYW